MSKKLYPFVLMPNISGDRVLSPALGHMLWDRLGASTRLAGTRPHAFSVKVMRYKLQVTVYCLKPGQKGLGSAVGVFGVLNEDLTYAEQGALRVAARHAACLYINAKFGETLGGGEVLVRAKSMFPHLAWGEDK